MIDYFIGGFLVLLVIYGFYKGFIVSIVNLVFSVIYLYFATDILNVGLGAIGSGEITDEVNNNIIMRYVVIFLVGIVLIFIINLILKKMLRGSVFSLVNRLGGVAMYLVLGYLLVCIVSLIVVNLGNFIDFSDSIQDSFFLSNRFDNFNILSGWNNDGR
jgi:uncharacterized membrane protein required for colicin V production